MGRRRHPQYSPEFKAEAIRLVRNSQDGLAKISRDLRRVEMERDILKKATAFFARQSE